MNQDQTIKLGLTPVRMAILFNQAISLVLEATFADKDSSDLCEDHPEIFGVDADVSTEELGALQDFYDIADTLLANGLRDEIRTLVRDRVLLAVGEAMKREDK